MNLFNRRQPVTLNSVIPYLALACYLFPVSSAIASKWFLIDRDLNIHQSKILSIDTHRVTLIDELGIEHNIELDDLFLIASAKPHQSSKLHSLDQPLRERLGTSLITLIDGQRFFAKIINPIQSDPDSPTLYLEITTQNQSRGAAAIELERILSVTSVEDQSLQPIRTWNLDIDPDIQDDVIITQTNDQLVGFIESIGPSTSIDTANGLISIDLDRIQYLSIANFPERTPGIFLSTDEETLLVQSLSVDFKHAIHAEVTPHSFGLDELANTNWFLEPQSLQSVSIQTAHQELISLATIEPEMYEPTGDRSWTPPPIVQKSPTHPSLSSIDLQAPVRVVYELPQHATDFACTLRGVIGDWTSCNVSIMLLNRRNESTTMMSTTIDPDHPSEDVRFTIPASSTHLVIEVNPGEFGPIQDRIILEKPRFLIQHQPE